MEQKPKPRRKRNRNRRKVNWGPLLTVLFLANIFLACFYSRITAIRSINLEGVRQSERNRLARVTDQMKGIPALKIDPRVVESSFMNESRVKNADFRRNLFGNSRLILQYRVPIASFVGAKNTFLDNSGVVFYDPEAKGTFPAINLQTKIKVSVMALSGVINYASVAELAQLVKSKLTDSITPEKQVEIDVQETGGVCLNINNGIVELGTCEQLSEKMEKLKQVLSEHPNLFESNSSLNLMIPERPQVVARKKESG